MERPMQRRSLDFMSNQLANGRRFDPRERC